MSTVLGPDNKMAALRVNVDGYLITTAGGGSQPISGAVSAAITSAVPLALVADTVTQPFASRGNRWFASSPGGGLTGTTSTLVKASAGPGTRNYITDIVLAWRSGVETQVSILDGVTALAVFHLSAASSPVTIALQSPMRGTATTALNIQLSVTGAVIQWYFGGFTSA